MSSEALSLNASMLARLVSWSFVLESSTLIIWPLDSFYKYSSVTFNDFCSLIILLFFIAQAKANTEYELKSVQNKFEKVTLEYKVWLVFCNRFISTPSVQAALLSFYMYPSVEADSANNCICVTGFWMPAIGNQALDQVPYLCHGWHHL